MDTILNLIGTEARRVTFSIRNDNSYYMLFLVIELLQPDMQDFNDYRGEKGEYLWQNEIVVDNAAVQVGERRIAA